MLFAISGSQGSGKTTVLNALKDKGYPVVERKTSRSILEEWGVTLSQVNNDRELTIKFQDEILSRKRQDEHEAVNDISRIWFTERTYADLFTYALIAIGKDNEYSNWINAYFKRCANAQTNYSANFMLPIGYFDIEHDGVRGANDHYANMVDLVMRDTLTNMNRFLGIDGKTLIPLGPKTVDITASSVDDRVKLILKNIFK